MSPKGIYEGSSQNVRRARGFLVPAILLLAWQLASQLQLVDPAFVPGPTLVLQSWWRWIFGQRTALGWDSGTWGEFALMSSMRVLAGFAIAAVLGVSVGIVLGWNKLMADLFEPFIQWLRPIPMTAWLPFATFIFGVRESAAIFLIALGAFYPIVVNCIVGAQQTPRNLLRAALMLGTSRRRLLLRIVLPSSLPYVFTGLRLGLSMGWILVIVVEMLAVKGGLGYAMWTAYQFVRVDLIIAAMLSLGCLGLLTDRLIVHVSRRFLRWNTGLTAR